MTGYPKGFYAALLLTLSVLAISGILLVPTFLDLQLLWDIPWRLPNAQRILVAAIHVIAGFVVFLFIGALWAVHMRRGWRLHRNRISGSTLATLMAALGLTGIGIYYFGGEFSSFASSASHTVLGLVAVGSFAVHFLRCQRTKQLPVT
jgi:hypothetical protein